jgi:GTP pyrophosphokinase
MTTDDFLSLAATRWPAADLAHLKQAVAFATMAHHGQLRKSGQPYVTHSLATAATLINLGLDIETVIAGVLHDVPEDTSHTLDEIQQQFGSTVAFLVGGVTKLGTIKYRGLARYVENLRRMFIATAQDVRVMIIKFADRQHNLQTLQYLPADKQLRIARESVEIYAPLAHRLGMGEMKGQLEDLAFPYLKPTEYAWVKRLVGERYDQLEKEIETMKGRVDRALRQADIPIVSIHGRRKYLYSLYEKLQRPENRGDITSITDLIAIRIIVPSVAQCYNALGLIHQLWRPWPKRFKDFIAQPKPNGYQSLHTTVFGPLGQPVEIQIRDQAMHQAAEFGVAAHWHYAESGKPVAGQQVHPKLEWIKELSEWKKEYDSEEQYLEALKIDALHKRIFCFTPNGDVIDLPEQATPIDFAYHVHSDLGQRCVGAKVNDRIVALDTELRSGDVVEIMIDKKRRRPNRDWLQIARTQTARARIRRALRESGS